MAHLSKSSLAVDAIVQASNINDLEGGGASIASFDNVPQASLEDMMTNSGPSLTMFDESALCMPAFRILRVSQHNAT